MSSAARTARAYGLSPKAFAVKLLQRLGDQPNPGNVRGVIGWENAEGGNWHNSAKFNPLNTTQREPGYKTFQSVGVGSAPIGIYDSWDTGLKATVDTLKNGRYGGVLAALRGNNPGAIADAVGGSPWGTSSSLLHSVIGRTPSQSLSAADLRAAIQTSAAPATPTAMPGTVPDAAVKSSILQGLIQQSNPDSLLLKLGVLAPDPQAPPAAPSSAAPTNQIHQVPLQSSAVGGAHGYVNPHPRGLVAPGRVDEGTDPTIAAGAPIVAVGRARIVNLSHNFYGSTPYLVYQLLDGPRKGQYVYESEYITPHVHPGQIVNAGDTVATGTGRAIEEGFAGGPRGSYLPLANHAQGGNYTEGAVTKAGLDWARFSRMLGARTGR